MTLRHARFLSNRSAANPQKNAVALDDVSLKTSKSDATLNETDNDNVRQTNVKDANRSSMLDLGPTTDHVTVFHRPTGQLIDLNVKSAENQMSIYMNHRSELLDFRLSEKFKRTVQAIHDEENRNLKLNRRDNPVISSVDDLLWKEMILDANKLPQLYMKLAKIRLTGLVVVTMMAGYALAPGSFHLATFLLVSVGTTLTSASANTINQLLEVPFDSQMNRTKNRPLVKGLLSPLHAAAFASVTGLTGAGLLAIGVNPLTAALGVFNLGLYTAVYTPMKRRNIANTWVGSIVGAIPPMMGWTASCDTLHPGAWVLAAIMYAWQFPHFCALSWNLRSDYSRAGYRMMSVVDPDLCKRTAFRYSIGMTGICMLVPYFGVTTWTFAVDSIPLNAYLAYLGWEFYRHGDSKSSRRLFRFSLVHIPALMILMLISKKQYGENTKTNKSNDDNDVEKLID